MRFKLWEKYALIFVLLIVATVSILSVGFLFHFRSSVHRITETASKDMETDLMNQIEKRGKSLALVLSGQLVNPVYRCDVENMYRLLRSIRNEPDIVYTYVYDVNGRILHDGHQKILLLNQVLEDGVSRRAVSAGDLLVQTTKSVLDVAIPIRLGKELLGGLRIGLSLKGIRNDIKAMGGRLESIGRSGYRRSMHTITLLAIILCLLGIFAAVFIGRNLSHPIVTLSKLAFRVGRGEYVLDTSIRRKDEIGDLASSFNKMTRNLKETTVSKKFVEHIIGSMNDSLVVTSPEGIIQSVNQATCDLLGYRKDELVGKPFWVLFETRGVAEQSFNDLRVKGKVSDVQTWYLSKDGKRIPVLFSDSVMLNDAGAIEGIVCVAQDITKLKEHEKFVAIGQMAATVAHEIRNPLGAVRNTVYYIKDSLKGTSVMEQDPAIGEFLDIADREITNSDRIITNLLDFSKTDRLSLKLTDINQLLREIKRVLKVPSNVRVLENYTEGLPHVMADPGRLRQVFLNLSTNAFEAMPQGGELEICMRSAQDSSILVDFKDTGVGISQENMKELFEPLFTTKTKGTGLGLAISKGIVEAHGGQISAVSEKGKGTTFTIKIPPGGA